jgi:multimeric flavodoxin WrbA
MKRILGVVGSPRRNGNTHILVSRILEGAREAGAAVEELFLPDLKIRECDGCHACWEGKECSKKDDMNNIYPRIIESDVIIFGTPVYWFGPTALMKAFLDRFVYFTCPENGAKVRGKAAAIAVPFEDTDLETAAPLVALFEKSFEYLHMDLAGKLLVPGVGPKGAVLEKPECLAEAHDLGISLARTRGGR